MKTQTVKVDGVDREVMIVPSPPTLAELADRSSLTYLDEVYAVAEWCGGTVEGLGCTAEGITVFGVKQDLKNGGWILHQPNSIVFQGAGQ